MFLYISQALTFRFKSQNIQDTIKFVKLKLFNTVTCFPIVFIEFHFLGNISCSKCVLLDLKIGMLAALLYVYK